MATKRNRLHLDFVKRELPCVRCFAPPPSDPAHIRYGGSEDKGGVAQKPGDNRVVPLCRRHHDEQHRVGEVTFWGDIDPYLDLAQEIWDHTGDATYCKKLIFKPRIK